MTEQDAKKRIESLKEQQLHTADGTALLCPRCGIRRMNEKPVRNAFSRHADVFICDQCGSDEALRVMTGHVLPLTEWAAAGIDKSGPATFLELLHSGEDLDCDLIIGGAEMPTTFVWDEDSKLTNYGVEKFRPVLEATFRRLDNRNIEVLCDDWELGEAFCLAAAGYIGDAEYNRIFGGNAMDD